MKVREFVPTEEELDHGGRDFHGQTKKLFDSYEGVVGFFGFISDYLSICKKECFQKHRKDHRAGLVGSDTIWDAPVYPYSFWAELKYDTAYWIVQHNTILADSTGRFRVVNYRACGCD